MSRFLSIFFLIYSASSFCDVDILSATYDGNADEITLEIRFPGGCRPHAFELNFSPWCLQSYPLQCSAMLVQTEGQDDPCKASVFKRLIMSASEFTTRPAFVNVISGESMRRIFVPQLSIMPVQ